MKFNIDQIKKYILENPKARFTLEEILKKSQNVSELSKTKNTKKLVSSLQ